MRTLPILALAAVLASPSVADAKNPWRGARGHRGGSAPVAVVPAPAAGSQARYGQPYPIVPAPAPRTTPYTRGSLAAYPVFPVSPLWWWGWGWGYGYYPLYPRPAEPDQAYGAPEPERVATTFAVRAAGARDGTAAGLELGIEGRRAGFDAGVDALAIDSVAGSHALGSSSAVGRGTMHVHWSIVSDPSLRIRLEAGGSMLSMPSGGAAAGAPWAGKVSFGPDLGVSGQLGLVGPFGIEGHARVTPAPVPVTDVRAAVALRAGALAVTGGWRSIHVAGDGVEAPSLRFSGPEIGLALIF